MTKQIPFRIAIEDLAELDAAVARGRFPNRSAALRAALALLLREEREQKIDEAYRRAYTVKPQEEWIGEAGLAAFAAFVVAEKSAAKPL